MKYQKEESKQKTKFLFSLLRHDIKNKIQIMQGYNDLLQELNLPEEASKYINRFNKALFDSLSLINKINTLKKLDDHEKNIIDLDKYMNNAIEKNKPLADEKGFEIFKEEINCEVLAGSLIEELFYNIIENSIKHSEGDKVEISSKKTKKECTIIIKDNGEGIKSEFIEGFSQKELWDKNSDQGIGLFLIKEIISIYDGNIEIKESNSEGTKFLVHFKRKNKLD